LGVEPADFGVFVGDPGIAADAVVVAALDHEGAGEDEVGHFGVVEGVAEVPVGHFPLDGAHEAEGLVGGGDFAGPLVEIAGADGDGVVLQQGRHAHGRFAAVAEAVKGDAGAVDEGLGLQPARIWSVAGR
jgi:hypothetical protein